VKLAATLEEAHADALEEAKAIAADMKDQDVKDAVAAGQIPEIVALIAYMNSLK
jgi:cytochrome c oxidase cbb3-type subunit 2